MKSDLERLLEASLEISRLKREADLSGALADEQSKLITCQRQEIARLNLRIAALELPKMRWPIEDLSCR